MLLLVVLLVWLWLMFSVCCCVGNGGVVDCWVFLLLVVFCIFFCCQLCLCQCWLLCQGGVGLQVYVEVVVIMGEYMQFVFDICFGQCLCYYFVVVYVDYVIVVGMDQYGWWYVCVYVFLY